MRPSPARTLASTLPPKIVSGGDHAAAEVFRIAQTAQRSRRRLEIASALRHLQRKRVLRMALVDASGREEEVPPEMMTLRQERGPIVLQREPLGRFELLERAGNVVKDAQRRR